MTLKYRYVFVLLAGAVICVASADDGVSESSRVPNGSLEQIDAERAYPEGWHVNGEAAVIVDDVVVCDGQRSLQIIFNGSHQDATVYVSVPPVTDVNKSLRITAQVRMHEFEGKLFLMAYRYPPPFDRSFRTSPIEGTCEWRTLSMDVPMKPGMTGIQVRVVAAGTWGRVWFDNVRATVVEAEVE